MNIIKNTLAFLHSNINMNSSLLAHHTILVEINLVYVNTLQQFQSIKFFFCSCFIAIIHLPLFQWRPCSTSNLPIGCLMTLLLVKSLLIPFYPSKPHLQLESHTLLVKYDLQSPVLQPLLTH